MLRNGVSYVSRNPVFIYFFSFFGGGVICFFFFVFLPVFLFPRSEMVCGRVMYRSHMLVCDMCYVLLASSVKLANLHLYAYRVV